MVAKKILTNPVLIIGLIMLYLLYNYIDKNNIIEKRRESLTPNSCKAIAVIIDKNKPQNWDIKCTKNAMIVDVDASNIPVKKKLNELQPILYQVLANEYIFLAKETAYSKDSSNESLARIPVIQINVHHPQLQLQGSSPGEQVVKLSFLDDKKIIAEHFSRQFLVKESAFKASP